MKRIYFLLALVVTIPILVWAAVPASGAVSQASMQEVLPQAPETRLPAGNYCISCHQAGDPRLASVTEWKGGIGRELNSACPAAAAIHKELYYTERMLLMIDRAGGAKALTDKMQARLEAQTQAYSRLLEAPVTSLEAFTSEAQAIRYQLNKVYAALDQGIEAQKRRTALMVALGASLVVLCSLLWGWLNTRSFAGGRPYKPAVLITAAVFLLAVAGLFSLPFFRPPPMLITTTTPEQQESQAVLDTGGRAASGADHAQARAWMLARLASADPARAGLLLNEARDALQEARLGQSALWGESLAVQEANIAPSIQLEKARLVAVELNAARARQWALPLVALEWAKVDPGEAAALLSAEEASLFAAGGLERDLQLRGLALAQARIEPDQALPSAAGIVDPGIRSWTQREIGALTGEAAAFEAAGESARRVADPVQRARSLRELAVLSGNAGLFDEALAALADVTGESLAYALSDLAVARGGEPSLAERINPAFPEARAAALLHSREPQAALNAALAIADPVERARAQAAIAGEWGNAETALQIAMQPYRDLALRDVTRKTGNTSLISAIDSVYYKVEALVRLGEIEAALENAGGLKDSYPLVQLGIRLADEDPQAALELVEGMTRETDKAVVLQTVAVQSGAPALFEQALGMALAARVRGDVLAPAQASLDLARALWTVQPANARTAWNQALEAARRIAIK